jgi:hypothetical protein
VVAIEICDGRESVAAAKGSGNLDPLHSAVGSSLESCQIELLATAPFDWIYEIGGDQVRFAITVHICGDYVERGQICNVVRLREVTGAISITDPKVEA